MQNGLAIIAAALALAVPHAARADSGAPPPIIACSGLTADAKINAISMSDAKTICRAMNLLDGVRVEDVRTFSKAYVVLSNEGYEGSATDITNQLVEVVKLRGLYDKPDRWYSTLDLVVRAYQAWNGIVSPLDVVAFLASAGPMAKTLSDDGLTNMLAYLKERKQQE